AWLSTHRPSLFLKVSAVFTGLHKIYFIVCLHVCSEITHTHTHTYTYTYTCTHGYIDTLEYTYCHSLFLSQSFPQTHTHTFTLTCCVLLITTHQPPTHTHTHTHTGCISHGSNIWSW